MSRGLPYQLFKPKDKVFSYLCFFCRCGKGGDLLKWQKSQATHLVGVDIAETSIEQCKDRYHRMKGRSPFTSEFYAADCTKVRTRDLYEDPDVMFDIVSCQFAFHYCFESLPQVSAEGHFILTNAQCAQNSDFR